MPRTTARLLQAAPSAETKAEKREREADEFKSRLEERLRTSMGASGTQIAKERLRNLQAYLAEADGEWAPPEIDDRSAIVATDAADTVEWMLPSLLRIFAASRDAIEVSPRRPQFEPQAGMVREVLRWSFWERMDGLTFLHNWLKDGLISKVGFCRVGYTTSAMPVHESSRGLTRSQLYAVVSPEGVEVTGLEARTEDMPDGQTLQVFDVDILRTEVDGFPTIDVVPPEEMRIDNGARYGSAPHFIAQEYRRRRSELEAEGYEVADVSSADDRAVVNEEAQARRQINTMSLFGDTASDDEDPEILVADCYERIGGEHAPKYRRGLLIGGELFEDEEVDDHPFGYWCPAPMPHVFFGHCPVDYAIEPQRLRTKLLRAVEDNVYLTVNGRTGVVGGDPATIDDILDSRPGGVVRLRTKDDLVPITQPDLSGAAWQAVEWAEQWTEKRTGFSRLSKGLSSEALNETATGVLEITERADMRTELVARHAAAALSKILTKVLRAMSKHQDASQWAQIAGQWVEIDPREWSNHYQVRVKVGLGAGNKDRQTAQLGQLTQMQQGLAQGGIVPPPSLIYGARKLAEAMGREDAAQLFPDPPPPNPNQPPPLPIMVEQVRGQTAIAIERERLAAKLKETDASLGLQASNDQRDAERERMKAELQAVLQQADQANRVHIAEMQEANRRAIAELQEQTRLTIAAMNQQAAQVPQIDTQSIARIDAVLQKLADAMTAPRRLIRDPATGRAVGAELVLPTAPQGPQQ